MWSKKIWSACTHTPCSTLCIHWSAYQPTLWHASWTFLVNFSPMCFPSFSTNQVLSVFFLLFLAFGVSFYILLQPHVSSYNTRRLCYLVRPSKKISCLSSEIFDKIRAGGRIFYFIFMYSVCGLCEQSHGPLRNGRCCSVLYVTASVTGSSGSAACMWPSLTKIKTQQEYIRISYVLLLIKNPARAIRPHNGNSSIHQVPTLSIFLALFYPYACNGPPSGLETVLSETCWLSFSTTFFDISMEWTRNRMSTFAYTSFSQNKK